ncbi:MAG: DoxX family protein [Candidatus Marinimicrobia bacterium]|nr:DoxX family protein [Candidatus Neomarinimicrobiota bacterium]MCF7830193.1 DoxX family protein [Candidatus Neomarinimicrobiota bacterium]MCF7882073.1 DoxX family protein [Candidatus Neomarinimicrobiota bacterium]
MLQKKIEQYKSYAPLLLRLGLAAVFIVHGYNKLSAIANTTEFFASIQIPLAGFFAWLVAFVEFFGGILVAIGLYTRIAAALIAVIMIMAMFLVKFAQGFVGGWEFDFTLFMVALALILLGSGDLSFGKYLESR